MSKFFISRPIVAMVISILMVIIGMVTIATLPIAQFPAIAPPEVQIRANYVGADAQTIEQSVATPIEQQMSGVDNLNYMYSLNAAGNGQMTMIVNFDVKSDPNTDLMLTQMRETQAASQLPQDVTNFRRDGAEIGYRAADGDGALLAEGHLRREISRQLFLHQSERPVNARPRHRQRPGVRRGPVCDAAVGEAGSAFEAGHHGDRSGVRHSGAKHGKSGRPGGRLRRRPRARNTRTPSARKDVLRSPEEFGDIIIRELPDGGIVRVRDVARIELGAQDYTLSGRINGKPGAIIAVYQLPGSNAVDAAKGVRKLMEEAKKRFPQDVDYVVSLDTTESVTEGIREIVADYRDRHRRWSRWWSTSFCRAGAPR